MSVVDISEQMKSLYDDGHTTNENFWAFRSTTVKPEDVSILREGQFGHLYGINVKNEKHVSLGSLRYKSPTKKSGFLCLHRFKVWWMRQIHINDSESAIPPDTMLLLGKDMEEDLYRLVLPVILVNERKDGCTTCFIHSDSSKPDEVILTTETGGTVGLYCGMGEDPFALVKDGVTLAIQMASNDPRRPPLSSEVDSLKYRLPSFAHYLGWCTWDSFYTNLNGKRVLSGLQSHKQSGVPQPRWMIIDDGWQYTTNDDAENGEQWGERLKSLHPSPQKFGKEGDLTLSQTVQALKLEGGVEHVFVWHALPGYWLGIDENSDEFKSFMPQSYRPQFSKELMQNDLPLHGPSISKGIGIAGDANAFYNAYHSLLASNGIDGVKVDGQAVMGILNSDPDTKSHRHEHQIIFKLHDALSSSIQTNFKHDSSLGAPIIHCMSHSPEIMYRLPILYPDTPPLMRASDDHYPDNRHSHGPHIVACSFNSLLFQHFCIPDWDMFTTSVERTGRCKKNAKLHAMSRSISGSPIYISDFPGKCDTELLNKVVCDDGSILFCSGALLPTRKSLLKNHLIRNKASHPLVLWNSNGLSSRDVTSGVLGIFDVAGSTWDYSKLNYVGCPQSTEESASTMESVTLCARDIEPFRDDSYSNTSFMVWSSKNWATTLSGNQDTVQVNIEKGDSAIVTILPILKMSVGTEIVPVGILGKYNHAGSILKRSVVSENKVSMVVRGCGRFGIAVRNDRRSSKIRVELNEKEVEYEYDEAVVPVGLDKAGFELIVFSIPEKSGEQFVAVEIIG